MYFVYIVECCDGSFYVGLTEDLEARVNVHQCGHGPSYTATRLPVRLMYSESYETLSDAVRRERQLKSWSRAKKAALIAGDKRRLKLLSKCRHP